MLWMWRQNGPHKYGKVRYKGIKRRITVYTMFVIGMFFIEEIYTMLSSVF